MSYYLYLIASFLFVVSGIGHLLIEAFENRLPELSNPEVAAVMNGHSIDVFGFRRSFAELMNGFGLTMGTSLAAYGILNILMVVTLKKSIYSNLTILVFNAFFSLTVAILSILYFHWPPIVLYSLASGIFLILCWRSGVEK